jgi:Mn2+/Fe2+ NRAMP family transporter
MDATYDTILIGMVGTTIAPWMQFYMQSAVVEKNVQVEHYPLTRIDVIFGCVVTLIVAISIIVACGATLHAQGTRIEDAKDAAVALAPLAGNYASGCIAFGSANASLFAASILPLATRLQRLRGDWAGSRASTRTSARRRQFFWLYTGLIVSSAGGWSSTRGLRDPHHVPVAGRERRPAPVRPWSSC